MYEFLAPWGVLVPAISAAATYCVLKHRQKRRQRAMLDAPASLALIFGSDIIIADDI